MERVRKRVRRGSRRRNESAHVRTRTSLRARLLSLNHELALTQHPCCTENVVRLLLVPLALRIWRKYPQKSFGRIIDAVSDALLAYTQCPESYNPERCSLTYWLYRCSIDNLYRFPRVRRYAIHDLRHRHYANQESVRRVRAIKLRYAASARVRRDVRTGIPAMVASVQSQPGRQMTG